MMSVLNSLSPDWIGSIYILAAGAFALEALVFAVAERKIRVGMPFSFAVGALSLAALAYVRVSCFVGVEDVYAMPFVVSAFLTAAVISDRRESNFWVAGALVMVASLAALHLTSVEISKYFGESISRRALVNLPFITAPLFLAIANVRLLTTRFLGPAREKYAEALEVLLLLALSLAACLHFEFRINIFAILALSVAGAFIGEGAHDLFPRVSLPRAAVAAALFAAAFGLGGSYGVAMAALGFSLSQLSHRIFNK